MDTLAILEVIVERANVGIFVVNEACELVLWNHFLESYSQCKATELIGKNLFDAFPELPRPWLERKIKNVFILKNLSFTSWEQRPYLFKFRHNRPITGGVDHMRQNCTFLPIKNPDGEVTHVCITLFDVTDTSIYQSMLKDAMHSLAEASNRDGLTGIYNRRFLEEILSREYSRVTRYGGTLSFILIDLDFFKKINDTHGHLAGDEVLKVAAARIQSGLRASDAVARYGGEEFAVILPETPLEGAAILADRLRVAIGSSPIQCNNIEVTIKTSVGVTQLSETTQNYEELIEQADQALYHSKENGRNQVTLYMRDQKNEIQLIPFQENETSQPPLTAEKSLQTHQPSAAILTDSTQTEGNAINTTTEALSQTVTRDETINEISLSNPQTMVNIDDLNEPTSNYLPAESNTETPISIGDTILAIDELSNLLSSNNTQLEANITTTTINESDKIDEKQVTLETTLEIDTQSSLVPPEETEPSSFPQTTQGEQLEIPMVIENTPSALDSIQPDTEFTTESQLNAEEATIAQEKATIIEKIMPDSTVNLPLAHPKNIMASSPDPGLVEQAENPNDIEENYEIRIKIGHS